ncbi:hypothetical protein IT774_13620 [Salinimonas marina]|uniref:P/Homo B domain-containing protein n=1 Tax=Salinimonas marina TaxID=2785918 RepID=A0A7S9DW99_9ALTE|nr:hypothetical protein [Salinimonas marina]QPG05154.1 hypothetical protein IT774_13620 [Salinimonas marina]
MNYKILCITALLYLVALPANATLILTGPGGSSVDTNPASVFSLTTTESGTISDLNFFIGIDAGCCAYDNTVELTHVESGTTARIWTTGFETGWQFGDILSATFDDESSNVFFQTALRDSDDYSILPGADFQAESMLSIFDGLDVFGTWQLSILDVEVPGENDVLLTWGIEVETINVPENTTFFMFLVAFLLAHRFR